MLVFVVLLSFLCSMFCFQLLLIQGDSMLPTFSSGRLCLINKMDRDYQKGDCILFYCPALEQNLVKRIVALPGDTVQISEGKLLINGIVTELYPSSHSISDAGLAAAPITVPEDCCFVLGDNFSRSIDSRHEEVGIVVQSAIKGKIIKAQA